MKCVTAATTFRWVLVGLALLGVCCVLTGIILGALHMTVGNSFLTLSLMFIGQCVLSPNSRFGCLMSLIKYCTTLHYMSVFRCHIMLA